MISTEKLLAVLHVVGGIAMFALAYQTTFWSFFVVMLVYQLAYMPTMSLTNAIVFHHVRDRAEGLRPDPPVGHHRLDRGELAVRVHPRRKDRPALHAALSSIFTVAGMASFALAAFSLTLPHTPPAKRRRGATRRSKRSGCCAIRRFSCCSS